MHVAEQLALAHCDYFCKYTYTDSTKNGWTADFVIKNINKKQGNELLLPEPFVKFLGYIVLQLFTVTIHVTYNVISHDKCSALLLK